MTTHRALLVLAVGVAVAGAGAGACARAQSPERSQQQAPVPSDVGQSDAGVRFQTPKVETVTPREAQPLRVARVEVHELAEGTQTGAAGDLLLTLHGQGFLETSKSPRVELGKMVLDDTMANREGTELYAIVPRQRVQELRRQQFREIVVVNPGGLQKTDYSRATVQAESASLLRPSAGAPRARLIFRGGVYVRELATP